MRESGARVLTSLKCPGAANVERGRRAGLEVIDDGNLPVRKTAVILSIVPLGEAMNVAERFRGRPVTSLSSYWISTASPNT